MQQYDGMLEVATTLHEDKCSERRWLMFRWHWSCSWTRSDCEACII